MKNITTAVFTPDTHYATTTGLWQYDYGQVLRIQGLSLPQAVEIHFSLHDTGGEAVTRVGVTKDGVTDVVIPDTMLENEGSTINYTIYAFVYLINESSGRTEYKISMKVKARPKPEGFDRPEDAEIFREAIAAVNDAAKMAEGWAHGRDDMPELQEDNAMYYAKKAETISDNAEKKVSEYADSAKESSEAAKEAEKAVTSAIQNLEETKIELEQTIKNSEESKETLEEAITESGTAITKVNEAIKNAGTAVEETVAATSETKNATEEAQTTEGKLKQSTADAEELKTSLDQAMGGVAQDATAEEILKILQISADYMAQIAESAGKAGSLNGFGLNLMEDGSVSLTYSDPDTGELQDSAILPKETTLAALDKALGEINESLKIIALREGGTV